MWLLDRECACNRMRPRLWSRDEGTAALLMVKSEPIRVMSAPFPKHYPNGASIFRASSKTSSGREGRPEIIIRDAHRGPIEVRRQAACLGASLRREFGRVGTRRRGSAPERSRLLTLQRSGKALVGYANQWKKRRRFNSTRPSPSRFRRERPSTAVKPRDLPMV